MTAYGKRTDIEIAAMKKQEAGSYNVMLPGSGTPWEDRGRSGVVSAFFKTCFQSLFNHRAMLDQIRRPETTSEATGFAIGCGAMWGLSIAIWDACVYYHYANNPLWVVSGQQYLIESALRVAAAVVLTIVFLKVAVTIFAALLGHAAQQQTPKVLLHNVLAYSLGPSVLAIIPVFGWALAALWIMVDAIIGTKTRLYLRTHEVIVNVLIATVVICVLFALLWVAGHFILPLIFSGRSIEPNLPPKPVTLN
jgi:hypothetical protein